MTVAAFRCEVPAALSFPKATAAFGRRAVFHVATERLHRALQPDGPTRMAGMLYLLDAIRALKRYIAREVFGIIMRRQKEVNQTRIAA